MTKEGEEQQQEEQSQPSVEPTSDKVAIDLNDLEDDEPEQRAQPERTENRKGRRAQFREMREAANKKDEQIQQLTREMAELRGQMSARQQQVQFIPQQTQQMDPVEAEISSIERQQQMILRAVAGAANQQEAEQGSQEWRALERKRRALEIQQAMASTSRQQDPTATEDRVVNQMLRAEFPEIMGDGPMRGRAMAEMEELLSRGKPRSIATAREACERVAERHGLRKQKAPPPSANAQARYTSVPSRAGTNGSASGQYVPSQNVLRTARAYTKHLPDMSDEDRVRKWVREVGKPNRIVE